MTDITLLRVAILLAGIGLLVAIWFFGRPRRAEQGRRTGARDSGRVEPSLGAQIEDELAADATAGHGRRASEEFDKIVTLYIAAKAGEKLRGPDIVVAAEKTGLAYGYMTVFHRLVEGHPERGPVFSVANIMKPGSFDMATIQSLETPAIAFFLTLPAPVSALDAWETMLPTAERMTELLGGVLLDESRSALGRQRIQHIREDLRAWDRQQETPTPSRSRW